MEQHIEAVHCSLQHCTGHPEAILYLHNPQLPQDIFLTEVSGLGGLDLTHPTWSPSVLRVKMLLQGEEEAHSEMFTVTVKWQARFLSPPLPCHGDSDLCCGPCCFLFPVLIYSKTCCPWRMVLALRDTFIAEPLTFDSEHVSSPGPVADAHHHPG